MHRNCALNNNEFECEFELLYLFGVFVSFGEGGLVWVGVGCGGKEGGGWVGGGVQL